MNQGAQGGSSNLDAYQAEVIAWIEKNKHHPGRLYGQVGLEFVVDRRGRLRSSQIAQGSGDSRLDRIALEQLRAAAPFPRPSSTVEWQTKSIRVNLVYRRG